MAAKSAFTDLKEKMLNQLGLSMNDTYYLRNEDTGLSQNLLRMMRVQMMRPSGGWRLVLPSSAGTSL